MFGVLLDVPVSEIVTSTQLWADGVWLEYVDPYVVYAKPIVLGFVFIWLVYRWFFATHKE